MRLRLERAEAGVIATLGILYVDDVFCCYTLEDPVREAGVKIPGQTAIPYGRFPVIITWSPKFKRRLPLIGDVPNFEGIRIHPGNTVDDTEGCILVGKSIDGDHLVQSRVAFDDLFKQLDDAQSQGEGIVLDIVRVA
jgi:hypothetical protein